MNEPKFPLDFVAQPTQRSLDQSTSKQIVSQLMRACLLIEGMSGINEKAVGSKKLIEYVSKIRKTKSVTLFGSRKTFRLKLRA